MTIESSSQGKLRDVPGCVNKFSHLNKNILGIFKTYCSHKKALNGLCLNLFKYPNWVTISHINWQLTAWRSNNIKSNFMMNESSLVETWVSNLILQGSTELRGDMIVSDPLHTKIWMAELIDSAKEIHSAAPSPSLRYLGGKTWPSSPTKVREDINEGRMVRSTIQSCYPIRNTAKWDNYGEILIHSNMLSECQSNNSQFNHRRFLSLLLAREVCLLHTWLYATEEKC